LRVDRTTSIVDKVTRDSLMGEYAQLHPKYGFERHKTYTTAGHVQALGRLGPLPLHRHPEEGAVMYPGVGIQSEARCEHITLDYPYP
jgi:hypothetical protein